MKHKKKIPPKKLAQYPEKDNNLAGLLNTKGWCVVTEKRQAWGGDRIGQKHGHLELCRPGVGH